MTRLITETTRNALKDYQDDSADYIKESMDWIRQGMYPGDSSGSYNRLTFSEMREIAKLKANHWKIKKGQKYVRQFLESEGDCFTFRTLPDILKICLKYKLYEDD